MMPSPGRAADSSYTNSVNKLVEQTGTPHPASGHPLPIGWGEGGGEGLPGFYQTSSALGITLQRGRGGGEMPPWVTEGSFFRLHA